MLTVLFYYLVIQMGSPPMITYGANGGSSATRDTGHTSLPTTVTGSPVTGRQYAVMAKIEDGK